MEHTIRPSRRLTGVLAGSAFSLFFSSLAIADSANDLFELSIEELINFEVTSVSRKAEPLADATSAVFVITRNDIQRHGIRSIPEALRLAPGLNVAQIDANKWAVGSRGFSGRYANKLLVTGVSTGFDDLAEKTSGMQRGDLIIVAGRPSMGKTAFSMNLAQNAAMRAEDRNSGVVAVFSLEMSSQQIALRMLACEARVDMQHLRTGRFSSDDWRKLAAASGSLAESKIFIDDTPAISVMELRSKCRRLKRENKGLDMVLID